MTGHATRDFIPDDFVARAPYRPRAGLTHMALLLLLIGAWWKPGCERHSGTVSRVDRRDLPRRYLKGTVGTGAGVDRRYGAIWLEEFGDSMVGYAMTSRLHGTKVGDEVQLWVRPDTGSVERLKNVTRPRKWWTH